MGSYDSLVYWILALARHLGGPILALFRNTTHSRGRPVPRRSRHLDEAGRAPRPACNARQIESRASASHD